MTVLDVQVLGGENDAVEYDDGSDFQKWYGTQIIRSNSTSSSRSNSGHVFDNITVPKGYTINTAYVELYINDAATDDVNCKVYANAVDNAADFTSEADVTSRAVTTAYASWVQDSLGTGWKACTSLVSVIQEIVNRSGWVSGNSICIIFKGNSDTSKMCYSYVYDQPPYTYGAKLHIEYSEPNKPHFEHYQHILAH